MENGLDVELHDEVLVGEIRLVTELMVVATLAPGELEQKVIDDVLGVQPVRQSSPSSATGPLSPRLAAHRPRTEEDLRWECWTGSPAHVTCATSPTPSSTSWPPRSATSWSARSPAPAATSAPTSGSSS